MGERVLAEQVPHLSDTARRFHGDALLWAGCHTRLTDTVRSCMVRSRLFTFAADGDSTCRPEQGRGLSSFRCELQAIPLPNNSLDAAVLHHGLELAEDPRTAVRELSRVLAPGARLVICGFNPISLWGLRCAYARFFKDSFASLHLVSPVRLQDWLTVLGFELCEEVRYLAYGMPFGAGAGAQTPTSVWHPRSWPQGLKTGLSAHNPPVGGIYIISAVKQAMRMRGSWQGSARRSPKLAPVAYPKLHTWNRVGRSG